MLGNILFFCCKDEQQFDSIYDLNVDYIEAKNTTNQKLKVNQILIAYYNIHNPKQIWDTMYKIVLKVTNIVDDYVYFQPIYALKDGTYKFYSQQAMIKYMTRYGITCGYRRKALTGNYKSNNNIYGYNGQPITEAQHNFLKKRAQVLVQTSKDKLKSSDFINKGCNCNRKDKSNV